LTGTRVADDQNVFFVMIGRTVYHNRLQNQCKGLSRTGNFSYGTLAGSMCAFDAIQVIDGFGELGRTCLLGEFHKVTGDDILAIIEGPPTAPTEPLPPAEVEDIDSESDETPDSTPE
jgi:hypothetical protein